MILASLSNILFSPNVCFYSEGTGDLNIQASCRSLLSEIYSLEDCNYYSPTEYSTNTNLTPIGVSLPANSFKLEFDIKPTSRSTSGWGSSSYLRIGSDEDNGLWVGQGTSAGKHGLMVRPGSSSYFCTDNTVLNTDNHITVIYQNGTATYSCNNETVSASASNLSKIVGASTTVNNHLKNIKVKPL